MCAAPHCEFSITICMARAVLLFMHKTTFKHLTFFAFALTCALAFASPARAQDLAQVAADVATPAPAATDSDPFYDGKLHVAFTPYIWLPTLNATFRYNLSDVHLPPGVPSRSGTIDASVGANKYLSNLNFALMGNAQFRFGNTALNTDLINVNASNQTTALVNLSGHFPNTTLTGTAHTHAVGTIAQVAGSNTFYRNGNTTVDVLLGGRMMFTTGATDWQLTATNDVINRNGSASRSSTLGDAIVGSFGQFALGKRWAIPFYADLGTGDPNFTWQGILGIKYGQLGLTYRYLDYSNGSAGLVQNLRMNGPQLGYTLKF
jgi:hypothetical protein